MLKVKTDDNESFKDQTVVMIFEIAPKTHIKNESLIVHINFQSNAILDANSTKFKDYEYLPYIGFSAAEIPLVSE